MGDMQTARGDLITSREACAILAINRSTLTRRVAAGKLEPTVRVPGYRGSFLFDRSDIEAAR